MIRAVKRLKASEDPSATFLCLSNANEVFINTILEVCNGYILLQ
jgi:pyridoxal phosphate phosphatase PHOSPHO2